MRISHINFAEKRELSGLEAGPSSGDSSHSPAQRQQKPREKPRSVRKSESSLYPCPCPCPPHGAGTPESPWEIDISAPSPVQSPEFVNVTRNSPQTLRHFGLTSPRACVPSSACPWCLGAFFSLPKGEALLQNRNSGTLRLHPAVPLSYTCHIPEA